MTAVNWEAVFIMFHKIMFRNDYWLFDEALDPVITILPDTFFSSMCSHDHFADPVRKFALYLISFFFSPQVYDIIVELLIICVNYYIYIKIGA